MIAISDAYGRWMDAEIEHLANPSKQTAEAAYEALEAMSALAFQHGYDPASDVDVAAWIIAKMNGDERS